MPPAYISCLRTGLLLPQDRDDLLLGEPARPHRPSPRFDGLYLTLEEIQGLTSRAMLVLGEGEHGVRPNRAWRWRDLQLSGADRYQIEATIWSLLGREPRRLLRRAPVSSNFRA